MVKQSIELNLKIGLHARPVSSVVNFVKSLTSEVFIEYAGNRANCSDAISLLALGIKGNAQIDVCLEGDNKEEELQKFIEFLKNLKD